MGRSDPWIRKFYNKHIKPQGDVALLGFTNNDFFEGDLYDLQLENWDINSDWKIPKKYDTIICTRCAYFAKDLESFFKKSHSYLKQGGVLYVDFGIGDHWRFDDYKIGWIKDQKQEYAYKEDNYLWSFVWSDEFLCDNEFKKFTKNVLSHGYHDVKKSIFEETPEIMKIESIAKYFDISYHTLSLWKDLPQFYVLLKCSKKRNYRSEK